MPDRSRPRRKKAPLSEPDRVRLAEERRHRAREELLDIHPRDDMPVPAVEVSNPLRGTRYRVYLPAFPALEPMACECTDFAHRDVGTCKHIEAVRLWVAAHGTEPVPWGREPSPGKGAGALWKEIDRRLSELERDERVPSVRIRAPGAALFELPPPEAGAGR
jgi:hypothetical protein